MTDPPSGPGPSGSVPGARCGVVRAPPSATATRTVTGRVCQVSSTAKKPCAPLAVCRTALAASSIATVTTSSRAGPLGSSSASQYRTRRSSASCPGKTRRQRWTGAGGRPAALGPGGWVGAGAGATRTADAASPAGTPGADGGGGGEAGGATGAGARIGTGARGRGGRGRCRKPWAARSTGGGWSAQARPALEAAQGARESREPPRRQRPARRQRPDRAGSGRVARGHAERACESRGPA